LSTFVHWNYDFQTNKITNTSFRYSFQTFVILRSEISLFNTLEKIFLGINNVTSIPTEIGLLSNSLQVLNLMHCILEGEIPTEVGLLRQLKKLDLSENFLEGRIPSELGMLDKVENLYLNHNYLAGQVPTEIFSMESIEGLNFAVNALSGTLPTELGLISNVQWLNTYGNWIEGTLPSELGRLHKMVAMHSSHNLFTGSIPTELGLLGQSNSLSLDIRYNELVGQVPSELGALTNLVILAMEGNSGLTGDMPPKICQLMDDWKLNTLSLDCDSVSCASNACGGDQGEYCLCPVVTLKDAEVGEQQQDDTV